MPVRKDFDDYDDFKEALRDYFAGQALIGLSSATDQDGTWTGDHTSGIGGEAYAIANDAISSR